MEVNYKISCLLFLGIFTLVSADRLPCEGVPNGVFVKNPTKCERFYYCNYGKPTPGVCPPDNYFDLRTGGCSEKANVYCEDDLCLGVKDYTFFKNSKSCQAYFICLDEDPLEGYCPDDSQIDVDLQRCNLKEIVNCEEPNEADLSCKGVPDDVLVENPKDCQSFITCKNERGTAGKCPDNKYFNKIKGECDDKENVQCGVEAEATSEPNTVEPLCEDLPDGALLPKPDNCNQFYECINGMKRLSACPVGQFFDPKNRNCQLDGSVCETTNKPNFCENKNNGDLVADPKDCKKYYVCFDGEVKEKMCPGSLLFNKEINTCDFEEHVKCHAKLLPFRMLFKN